MTYTQVQYFCQNVKEWKKEGSQGQKMDLLICLSPNGTTYLIIKLYLQGQKLVW